MLSLPMSPFLRYNPKLPRRAIDPREISTCVNTEIKSGEIVKSFGWVEITGNTFDATIRHIAEHVTNNGTRFLCVLTLSSFYVYNTSNSTWYNYTRTGDPYAGSYQWSSCSYGDLFIFTNGVDEVQQWDGADTDKAIDLNADATRPELVMTFGAHLIVAYDKASASSVDSKLIKWSVPGTPTDFSGAGSGSLYVYEGKGGISAIAPLTRDTIAIYKTDSIHLMEYVAAPQYFVMRNSMTGIGVSSRGCYAVIGNDHIVLTNNGLRKFNGAVLEPFAPEIDPVLLSYYPNKNSKFTQLLYDGYTNKLWIFLPSGTATWEFTTALVYSFRDVSWSVQSGFSLFAATLASLPNATEARWTDLGIAWNSSAAAAMFWGGQSTVSNLRLVVANASGDIFKDDGLTQLRDGVAYVSKFETGLVCPGLILFQDPMVNTELVQLDVGLSSGSVTVYIGTSNRGDESISWNGPYTPDSNGIVYKTLVGRWFIFRVEGSSDFSVSGLNPWFVKRGRV